MLSTKTLTNAVAVLIVAGMAGACSSHSNSAPTNNKAPSAPAAVEAVQSGSVSLARVTHEDGSDISDSEIAQDVAAYPSLGSGMKLLSSATQASIQGDVITLSDADGPLAVIKKDGTVVSSQADLPLKAFAMEAISDSNGRLMGMHFNLHAVAQNTDASAAPAEAGFNVALVMEVHGDDQASDQSQAQGQAQAQAQAQSQSQQQQQAPMASPTPCPSPAQQQQQQVQTKEVAPVVQSKEIPAQTKEVAPAVQTKEVAPVVQPKEVIPAQTKEVAPAVQTKEIPAQTKEVAPAVQTKEIPAQTKEAPAPVQSKEAPAQTQQQQGQSQSQSK